MKWLPFLLFIIFSCKNGTSKKTDQAERADNNNGEALPSGFSLYEDSGYFKGYWPVEIDSLEIKDTSLLSRFLSSTISKKDILLLNKETLSHTAFVDKQNKTRMDTLQNEGISIISKYVFDEKETQLITINGVVIKDYQWKGEDPAEDVFNLDEYSFRHFSFKGKEYYYIQAGTFYSSGSASNICYHLLYSVGNKRLSYFQTCRFCPMLFGDVNGDADLDYLDFDNSDFCTGVPGSDNAIIQLYSCDNKGNFVLQKDKKGKPFFIEGRTGERYTQDSFNVKKYYWPTVLK